MTWEQTLLVEGIKLVLQFGGALCVAKLAVRWALDRYKSENVWERRLSAYADAVSAFSEMRLVLGRWFDDSIIDREPTAEQKATQEARFRNAKRRIEDGIATARLLLPAKTAQHLSTFEREFDRAGDGQMWQEVLDNQISVVVDTLDLIIKQGRAALGEQHLK